MNVIIKTVFGFLFAGVVVAWAAPPSITSAVTPGTMSYQGRLQTPEGVDYDNGIYTVEFRLYDSANENNLLWGATYKPYVNNGFFSVILGQTNVGETPIAGAEFTAVEDFWKGVWIDPNSAKKNRYLGITVLEGADNNTLASPSESFPRQELLASPFAIQAQFAQQASHAEQAAHAATADASASDFTLNGALVPGGSTLVLNGNIDLGGTIAKSTGNVIVDDNLEISNGNYLYSREFSYLYGTTYFSGQLSVNGHSLSHVVQAPASGVRMVAGNVNQSGTETRDVGNQFTVSKTGTGTYYINFSPDFSQTPVVVVQGGPDGNAIDNFYQISSVDRFGCYVKSSDDDPSASFSAQDAAFNFIAIGQ
ncbi:hypothetical protein P4C99_02700 [Pontiellaceae bacterium B1224]|nr:hypothetical protein [Pontiellaceae bacterium B1224]